MFCLKKNYSQEKLALYLISLLIRVMIFKPGARASESSQGAEIFVFEYVSKLLTWVFTCSF